MMKDVEEIDILPITFADHRPLLIKVRGTQRRSNWRLNTFHLNNKRFVENVKEEMKLFFDQNVQPEISMLTVWEISKAFFRGLAIRFASIQKTREKGILKFGQKFHAN